MRTNRWPDDTQRFSIVGRTGSGKTVAATWFLGEHANWTEMPWVIYDFKRDSLLAKVGAMKGAEHISTDYVPRKPGLYFVHPHPDDTDEVNQHMKGIWEQQNTGVFIDEGYMVSNGMSGKSWLRTLLQQGRSLHIPMVILSQRPVWMDRFVFSESDFYQVFRLNHSQDRKRIMEYVPADLEETLPEFHSYYHDVAREETFVMRPVVPEKEILSTFDQRLDAMRQRGRRVFI